MEDLNVVGKLSVFPVKAYVPFLKNVCAFVLPFSVIERAKIFKSSPASDLPWRMATSVRKGGRRTALMDYQSVTGCIINVTRDSQMMTPDRTFYELA